MGSYGGLDLAGRIQLMMQKVFLPPLATKFTHFGLGTGKRNFSITRTFKVLAGKFSHQFCMGKQNQPSYHNTFLSVGVLKSEKFDEAAIKSGFVEWFRRSGERLKTYRKKVNLNDVT